jgi:hypothetical protein
MNQAPSEPSTASTSPTASGPVVLRLLPHFIYFELALTAAGIVGFLTLRHTSWGAHPFWVLIIGSPIWAMAFALFEIRIQDGRLIFRDRFRSSRSVDLRQLVSVTAPAKSERWLTGRRFMVLTDRQGAQVRLTLYGTRPSQRRRVLAELEPYIMADGVSRDGLVAEALSGELWWPHLRRPETVAKAA